MTTTSARLWQIWASFRDKEYRDLFVSERIDTTLPFQIRAMREARGWRQRDLSARVGMTQEGVSRLENPDYGRFTLATLKRLASAFDVALEVRFVPFSQIADWVANLSPEDLVVPDYENDREPSPAVPHFDAAWMEDLVLPMRPDTFGQDVWVGQALPNGYGAVRQLPAPTPLPNPVLLPASTAATTSAVSTGATPVDFRSA